MKYTPDKRYMERALQLAAYGAGFVSPNPMVGAVIVAPDGRIIGQGWHRRYGGPHAEVNAVNSVAEADAHLIPESTIYVTLEPCSHYGKTPPCSLLLIQKKIRRVVVGSPDPFPLVAGRGIKMLREAEIEVIEGFMQEECDWLNRRFITAHTYHRPYILLKWAQSADGYMASLPPAPVQFSGPITGALMHAHRALSDAILVGVNTILVDNPTLTTRHWPGNSPRPVTFNSPRLKKQENPSCAPVALSNEDGSRSPMILSNEKLILLDPSKPLETSMHDLYEHHGITSLLVEGGPETLRRFLDLNLFDAIRVEIAPIELGTGLPAPSLPYHL
ncbi:MAG: bifunctional diaminohydroxyphosphoribosylaminopyrimidine deaminase/5-amino-6-(5-phosphoribosylamino)uracil reductase RibD [Muribaculaceae bacterium]|nr:bifunctional diaminohydroxyphosphoribosylaminopyrimidine deaminase/5-amino-6-(5-phosphoribosylamino)uracil reductase RibD [Muribaculaceae bacterium]